MPRPSKYVSPDTLGGRIRAARKHLHLSLAEVANGQYSTSLISQIERNRIEPSHESLRFLADRLHLPLADLETLAQQPSEIEIEPQQIKSYEDLRNEAARLLTNKEPGHALDLLNNLYFPQIPPQQRWRLAALRGHCHFARRRFLKAQQDFAYAVHEHPRPELVPTEQKLELLLLHLHLAGTYREIRQLEDAHEHYRITLALINRETPFGYVAEAHWGMALICFALASTPHHHTDACLHTALEHASNACFLYRSIDEQLRAAMVSCQIALIEQMLGHNEQARASLQEILSTWSPVLQEPLAITHPRKRCQQEKANLVSLAACSLANLELDARNYALARCYANCALEAGKRSYKLRRADAYLILGRISENIDGGSPETIAALRSAIAELADTDRISARMNAHMQLGRHLLKIGHIEEGEQELEQAQRLTALASPYAASFEDALA